MTLKTCAHFGGNEAPIKEQMRRWMQKPPANPPKFLERRLQAMRELGISYEFAKELEMKGFLALADGGREFGRTSMQKAKEALGRARESGLDAEGREFKNLMENSGWGVAGWKNLGDNIRARNRRNEWTKSLSPSEIRESMDEAKKLAEKSGWNMKDDAFCGVLEKFAPRSQEGHFYENLKFFFHVFGTFVSRCSRKEGERGKFEEIGKIFLFIFAEKSGTAVSRLLQNRSLIEIIGAGGADRLLAELKEYGAIIEHNKTLIRGFAPSPEDFEASMLERLRQPA